MTLSIVSISIQCDCSITGFYGAACQTACTPIPNYQGAITCTDDTNSRVFRDGKCDRKFGLERGESNGHHDKCKRMLEMWECLTACCGSLAICFLPLVGAHSHSMTLRMQACVLAPAIHVLLDLPAHHTHAHTLIPITTHTRTPTHPHAQRTLIYMHPPPHHALTSYTAKPCGRNQGRLSNKVDCGCFNGFKGLPSFLNDLWEDKCIDINECLIFNGGCAQTCNNTDGGYTCSCRAGFKLNADGKTCSGVCFTLHLD